MTTVVYCTLVDYMSDQGSISLNIPMMAMLGSRGAMITSLGPNWAHVWVWRNRLHSVEQIEQNFAWVLKSKNYVQDVANI